MYVQFGLKCAVNGVGIKIWNSCNLFTQCYGAENGDAWLLSFPCSLKIFYTNHVLEL